MDALVAVLPDFIYAFDLEGRFTYANPALYQLLQLPPGAMVGLNFHDLNYPMDLATLLQGQIQEVIHSRRQVRAETEFRSASGVGHYEYIFVPLLDDQGAAIGVGGTTRDITDRRSAEMSLRESQTQAHDLVAELEAERAKLRRLFEQAPAFIAVLTGSEFRFEFANDQYYRLVGYREVLGKTVKEAFPEVEIQGFISLLEGVFATGESFIGKNIGIVLEHRDGTSSQHYLDFVYQAIRGPQGVIVGILVHGVDVTEQVFARSELDRLNGELEARVKERTRQLQAAIEELEGFSYTVSHDLRAPLRAIVSSSKILQSDFGEHLPPAAQFELDRQANAASRLATIIDELLKLTRLSRQEIKRIDVDLSDLAFQVAMELKAAGEDNECLITIEPGLSVMADLLSVRLLLFNLIGNACKFSKRGGQIEVGRGSGEGEGIYFVRDYGVGFDIQYVKKVFLPFERLVSDQEFPGTGIGLANVKRIVDRHGGRIWAESKPGEGSTFFFTLHSDA